ncbi:hypothetical protein [Aliiroseovarius sp. S253]|uniref:hypothetical protein n=1 Tax=Aliiroseovarius sp. S253 TaxID=3415133 RepID=UPI003C7EA2DE
MAVNGFHKAASLGAVFALSVGTAQAQTAQGTAPMSAIGWLSDSVALPAPSIDSAVLPPDPNEPETATGASVAQVTMSLIETPVLDAVGLLSSSTTGFALDLWGQSRPDDLARRISGMPLYLYPAMQDLLNTLLLTELNPPKGARTGDDRLFMARVDRLLAIGALDQAEALLSRAGNTNPRVFRRGFDTALLLGSEDRFCNVLKNSPDLSPTFPARVFCLARSGEWEAAVLTLETGLALGYISDFEDALLARFLDPELFEGEPPLQRPSDLTPLTYRMFEAIGEHIPTGNLPLAFAQADLRANVGWKARAEAGERLARVGSATPNQLLGLYTERRPAASGGIWDRMQTVRRLEQSLNSGNEAALSASLMTLWPQIEDAALEVPFANLFGERLMSKIPQDPSARNVALSLGLLSSSSEAFAAAWPAQYNSKERLLTAIALGNTDDATAYNATSRAVVDGLNASEVPVRLKSLMDSDRVGEAILRAIALYESGTHGNLDEIADALAFFRQIGLERVARQAALEVLILERRG